MIGKASWAIIALVMAYLLVTLTPGLVSEVAARTAPKAAPIPAGVAQDRKGACAESWPYYEPSCLHDGRQPGGRVRTVRIVSAERLALQSPGLPMH